MGIEPCCKGLEATLNSKPPTPVPSSAELPPLWPSPPPAISQNPNPNNSLESPPLPFLQSATMSKSTPPAASGFPEASSSSTKSLEECMNLLMASHQASIAQAQADLQAQANRMAHLEEAWLGLAVKPKLSPERSNLEAGRVDLQKFCVSDGPMFSGPVQSVKPSVLWIHGVC
ncbi:hypothetical protein VP01_2623g7 [Puccinia sorghi]|uniref:Uncharacterized protein n=1 Tax=Puccinia sorghi TaxID=27349 RepID=A0A0L6V693_9BASI|nr:hypothetical protein VP01_2623g7 [Puccinia sorghi]